MPFHTRSHGPDMPALVRGLAKTVELSKGAGIDAIYLAPALQNVSHSQLAEILGEKAVKAFLKDRVMIIDGVTFHLETKLKKKASGPAIVLAVHLPLDQLANMRSDHRTRDFVYVTWSDVELKQYEAANPQSISL